MINNTISQEECVKQCLNFMSRLLKIEGYEDIKSFVYYQYLDNKARLFVDNVYRTTFWNFIQDNDIIVN